jgi:hypothetical protein
VRFTADLAFPAPPDVVLGIYTDPTFYDGLHNLPHIGRPEVLDHRASDGQVTMRIRYQYRGDLPSAAYAVIAPEKLTWVEETVFDLRAATATSRLLPDHYPDRLKASARSAFRADDGGTVRHVEGELKVRALLVAGKVEQAIVSGLREHLVDERGVVLARLEQR